MPHVTSGRAGVKVRSSPREKGTVSSSLKVAALFACLPTLLTPQTLQWSEPTPLGEFPGSANAYLASSPNGSTIVIWGEYNPSSLNGGDFWGRISTPGSGWSPAMLVSDGSGYLQDPVAVVMGDDGTAIASWRQIIEQPLR